MRFAKTLTAAAAVSLVATPALAQAVTSASNLSVSSVERTGGAQSDENELAGGSGIIIAILAAAAVIAGIIIAVDGGDDDIDFPVSP